MSARKRPLYARLLRLRHLTLRPAVAFLLFEGSIGLGVLLALAEIVNGWGIVAVPVTVAAMVKLNDIVAGALAQLPHVAPVGAPSVVSAGVAVPPQNRATQPGRGASMRRTRAIVGRARLGSARGIVYVHAKPPETRRPGSVSARAAFPSPSTASTRPPQSEPVLEPPSDPHQPTAAGQVESAGTPHEGSGRGPDASPAAVSPGAGSGQVTDASPRVRSGRRPEEAPDARREAEETEADRTSANQDRAGVGDQAAQPPPERPNPDRGLDRSYSDRTDRNKGRFA